VTELDEASLEVKENHMDTDKIISNGAHAFGGGPSGGEPDPDDENNEKRSNDPKMSAVAEAETEVKAPENMQVDLDAINEVKESTRN